MQAAVRVRVRAEDEPARLRGQPVGHRRHLGEQVGPVGTGARVGRDQQPPGARPGGPPQPFPQRGDGPVDRGHGGAPPQQARHRRHLGPGPERGDRDAVQPQPLRVREHVLDRLGQRRLGHAGGDPRLDLAADLVPAQPPPAVRQDQLALGLAVARHLGGAQGPAGRLGQRCRQRVLGAVGAGQPQLPVQLGEAALGHREPALRVGQAGLDQPAEVCRVVRPPGRRPFDRGRARLVDRPQRRRQHGPAERGGAAPAVRPGRHDHPRELPVRHAHLPVRRHDPPAEPRPASPCPRPGPAPVATTRAGSGSGAGRVASLTATTARHSSSTPTMPSSQ